MTKIPEDFKIWENIQDHWPQESQNPGFTDPTVLSRITGQVRQSIDACQQAEPDQRSSINNQYPLPVLISVMLTEGPVTVLDFGGGMGQTFVATQSTVPDRRNLNYYVLEFGELAKAGKKLFCNNSQVHFIDGFQAAPEHVDIIFAGAAFQYIDDWNGLLEKFASFAPKYIAFGNLLAGDIKPLVTFQNIWGHKIPVRFHNFDDLIGTLASFGYQLIYDAFHEQTILGKKQPLPLDHFPENQRLKYGRNVILRKF